MTRLLAYKRILYSCFLLWFCTVLILSAERCMMFQHYLPDTIRTRYAADTVHLFVKGLLFDIKAASVLTALPFLLGLFSLVKSKTAAAYGHIQVVLSVLLLLAVSACASSFSA